MHAGDHTTIWPVSAMEPLLPRREEAGLVELACRILFESGRLSGSVHARVVREKVAGLIRAMNCYYSNLIEGHKTLPRDMERALRREFASDPVVRDHQLLALAHMDIEQRLDEWIAAPGVEVYHPDFICGLHRAFYEKLPASMKEAQTISGKRHVIIPGAYRDYMVDVGRHTPPPPASLSAFMARFCRFYGTLEVTPDQRLVAIAAAHHRLAWIHPFGDGNGRVARLYSQALLKKHGLDGGGWWALSRGLAREQSTYYARLADADQPRRNDVDGRGPLSAEGLGSFCRFFLESMLDQIRYMSGILALPGLRSRIERTFMMDDLGIQRYREEIMKVVRVLADEGEIQRHRVREITGKRATVSAEVIKEALAHGVMESPSSKGVLRIAFPEKVLAGYFPRLFGG